MSTFLVGGVCLLGGLGVSWVLPRVGTVAGGAALDLDGSLFGVHALRGMRGSGSSTGCSSSSGDGEGANLLRTSLLGGDSTF